MGKVFLIQFDQTPENRFYLCRTCQAHIVLSQDLNFGFIDQELSGTVFENVVNVYTRSPEQDRTVGNRVVSDVYCNQCNNLMGIKFIEVPNDEPMVREGYFLLKTAKLSRWNGQDIVDVEL